MKIPASLVNLPSKQMALVRASLNGTASPMVFAKLRGVGFAVTAAAGQMVTGSLMVMWTSLRR